jgi:hypothetical protein
VPAAAPGQPRPPVKAIADLLAPMLANVEKMFIAHLPKVV